MQHMKISLYYLECSVTLCVCLCVTLTRHVKGQSVACDSDLLLGVPDPLGHSPPALHGESDVSGHGFGSLLDAQLCRRN